MAFTEEQARTKWCPFARVSAAGFEAANRLAYRDKAQGESVLPPASLCVASACMAWVNCHGTFHVERNRFLEPGERFSSTDQTESRPNGKGFCGLAERDV